MVLLTVAEPPRAQAFIEALRPLLDRYLLLVMISPVNILRPEKFRRPLRGRPFDLTRGHPRSRLWIGGGAHHHPMTSIPISSARDALDHLAVSSRALVITSRYIHTVDTSLNMAADSIAGYIQCLMDGVALPTRPMRSTGILGGPRSLTSWPRRVQHRTRSRSGSTFVHAISVRCLGAPNVRALFAHAWRHGEVSIVLSRQKSHAPLRMQQDTLMRG